MDQSSDDLERRLRQRIKYLKSLPNRLITIAEMNELHSLERELNELRSKVPDDRPLQEKLAQCEQAMQDWDRYAKAIAAPRPLHQEIADLHTRAESAESRLTVLAEENEGLKKRVEELEARLATREGQLQRRELHRREVNALHHEAHDEIDALRAKLTAANERAANIEAATKTKLNVHADVMEALDVEVKRLGIQWTGNAVTTLKAVIEAAGLKPGDVVFRPTGERRAPKDGEQYQFTNDEVIDYATYDWEDIPANHRAIYRRVSAPSGEQPDQSGEVNKMVKPTATERSNLVAGELDIPGGLDRAEDRFRRILSEKTDAAPAPPVEEGERTEWKNFRIGSENGCTCIQVVEPDGVRDVSATVAKFSDFGPFSANEQAQLHLNYLRAQSPEHARIRELEQAIQTAIDYIDSVELDHSDELESAREFLNKAIQGVRSAQPAQAGVDIWRKIAAHCIDIVHDCKRDSWTAEMCQLHAESNGVVGGSVTALSPLAAVRELLKSNDLLCESATPAQPAKPQMEEPRKTAGELLREAAKQSGDAGLPCKPTPCGCDGECKGAAHFGLGVYCIAAVRAGARISEVSAQPVAKPEPTLTASCRECACPLPDKACACPVCEPEKYTDEPQPAPAVETGEQGGDDDDSEPVGWYLKKPPQPEPRVLTGEGTPQKDPVAERLGHQKWLIADIEGHGWMLRPGEYWLMEEEMQGPRDWLNRRSEIEAQLADLRDKITNPSSYLTGNGVLKFKALTEQLDNALAQLAAYKRDAEVMAKDHKAMNAVRSYGFELAVDDRAFAAHYSTHAGMVSCDNDDPADAILALASQLSASQDADQKWGR